MNIKYQLYSLITLILIIYKNVHIQCLELEEVNEESIYGIDLEKDNQRMEKIIREIEDDKSINNDLIQDNEIEKNEELQDNDDSFVKFDTRKMRHFSIEDITFNNAIKKYDDTRTKYHRIVKSGIKFAEYSLELSKKQKRTTFLSSGLKKKKKLYLNMERSIASSSIIASVTMLKSLLYKELPTNTKWAYSTFFPLILCSYLEAYNNTKDTTIKGFFAKSLLKKKKEALHRLNKSLITLSRHINKLDENGTYKYDVEADIFWRIIEPTVISPAHGLITTDIIKKPKNMSSEYLKDVLSILRSEKYKLTIAQNKAREDFYYYVKHDLEFNRE